MLYPLHAGPCQTLACNVNHCHLLKPSSILCKLTSRMIISPLDIISSRRNPSCAACQAHAQVDHARARSRSMLAMASLPSGHIIQLPRGRPQLATPKHPRAASRHDQTTSPLAWPELANHAARRARPGHADIGNAVSTKPALPIQRACNLYWRRPITSPTPVSLSQSSMDVNAAA